MRGQFVAVDQRAARDAKTAIGKRKQVEVETALLQAQMAVVLVAAGRERMRLAEALHFRVDA
jgi:hypothetical protein